MNNEQFREYIQQRRDAIEKELRDNEQLSQSARAALKEQDKMLESARRIMTFGTGPERRRFRRDYERRLRR